MNKVLITLSFIFCISYSSFSKEVSKICERKSLGKKVKTHKNKYAKKFSLIEYENGIELITTKSYFLSEKNLNCSNVIKLPVQKLALTSTTYLPWFEMLGGLDQVFAFSNKRYVYGYEKLKNRVKDINHPLNIEKVINYNLDLVLGFNIQGQWNNLEKLSNLKTQFININEFDESTPLARAEWIKVIGVVLGKFKKSQTVFNDLEAKYIATLKKASKTKNRMTFLIGSTKGGIWYAPTPGHNFIQILSDAGGSYMFMDKKDRKNKRLRFSKGSIYTNVYLSNKKVVWIPMTNDLSRESLKNKNYSSKFLQKLTIYNPVKRYEVSHGNDFWQSAFARPDILLNDLIKIINGEKQESLYYFKEL